MSKQNRFYYISSGALNAMRTLRSVISVPGVYFRDEYICNLARDWDEAMAKARARVGTEAEIRGSDFNLNEWGKYGGAKVKPWMRKQLDQIEMGIMPFGKHKGREIKTLPEGYVKYWVEQVATNTVGQVLVQKFTDIANELDYFAKWDGEEKAAEKAYQEKIESMDHVGVVGERKVVFVRCDKVLGFSGGPSWSPYTTYLNICVDRHGNEFVYRGSKRWEEGKYYKATVTIKEHKTYKGKPQTVFNRPTIHKVIEKETT